MTPLFTLAIATSLTGVSAVSSLRGVAGTFEDQAAVALGDYQGVSGPFSLFHDLCQTN